MVNLSRKSECYFEVKVGAGILKTTRDLEELMNERLANLQNQTEK